MQLSYSVCGNSDIAEPEQAIFCEVTTVRLVSHGRQNNQVLLTIRNAEEKDINIAALTCLV